MLLFLSCMVANGGIAVPVCIVEVVWERGGRGGGDIVCTVHLG